MDNKIELGSKAKVYTSSGKRVGNITRVVFEPDTMAVSHLVVKRGRLHKQDRVVPTDAISVADTDRLTLRAGIDARRLPPFEEERYVNSGTSGMRRRTSGSQPPQSYPVPRALDLPYYAAARPIRTVERNVPAGSIALEVGARVASSQGDKLGRVKEIIMDGSSASHIVVESAGILSTDAKAIPIVWVDDMDDETVRLSITKSSFAKVPALEPSGV